MGLLEQRKRRRERLDSLLSAREEFREERPDAQARTHYVVFDPDKLNSAIAAGKL